MPDILRVVLMGIAAPSTLLRGLSAPSAEDGYVRWRGRREQRRVAQARLRGRRQGQQRAARGRAREPSHGHAQPSQARLELDLPFLARRDPIQPITACEAHETRTGSPFRL